MLPISSYRGIHGGVDLASIRNIKFKKIYDDGYERFVDVMVDKEKESFTQVIVGSWVYSPFTETYTIDIKILGDIDYYFLRNECYMILYNSHMEIINEVKGSIHLFQKSYEDVTLSITGSPFHYSMPPTVKMSICIQEILK